MSSGGPRDRKGTRGGSGKAQRAAQEVLVALRHPRKTVARASIASVKKLRDRAAKSRSSTLRELVSEDARAIEVAVRMECYAWAKGGTISKMLKSVSAARLHEAIVGAHARRTGKKNSSHAGMSLEAYAALAEQGLVEADAKRKKVKEHLEATPEKDDERAAARERAEAKKKRGGMPLTPQSASHAEKMLKKHLDDETKRNAAKKRKEKQAQQDLGNPSLPAGGKRIHKPSVLPCQSERQVAGRIRYYATLYPRTPSGKQKYSKSGSLRYDKLVNNEPKSAANPDGGQGLQYFPSPEAGWAAIAAFLAKEEADIAAFLAKKAKKAAQK